MVVWCFWYGFVVALPDAYRSALGRDVPEGRACGNCVFFDESRERDGEAWCSRWDDWARGDMYCDAWEARGDEGEMGGVGESDERFRGLASSLRENM